MHEARVSPLDVLKKASAHAELVDAPNARRVHALARLGAHAFPLRLAFRGLVTGRRDLPEPCLEVLPEGYGLRALTTLGPVLVPTDRPLAAGSVVRVVVDLQHPDRYVVQPAGLLARTVRLDAEVGVEP